MKYLLLKFYWEKLFSFFLIREPFGAIREQSE